MEKINKRGKPNPGVYIITCLANNKIYIGSSSYSIDKRIKDHKSFLIKNKHKNQKLQNSYNKYGADSFVFEKLETCLPENCIKREQYWIDLLEACGDMGFNLAPIAGSTLGYKYNEFHKNNVKKGIQKAGGNKGDKNPRFGAIITKEQIEKYKDSLIKNGTVKKMCVLNKDLEIVFSAYFCNEIANFIGCDKSFVLLCVKNKSKTAKGYVICYEDNLENKLKQIKSNPKYFDRYGTSAREDMMKGVKITNILSGEVFIFKSRKEATSKMKFGRDLIGNVIAGRVKSKIYTIENYE